MPIFTNLPIAVLSYFFLLHIKIINLRELHWLLGIEVSQNCNNHTLSPSQKSYLESIIHCFGFEELKPVSNLMEPSMKLYSR